MKRLIGILFLIFSLTPLAFSATSGSFCPVSGEETNGKITQTYNGKTYSFCCPKCVKNFKDNPEKYLNSAASQAPAEAHVH